MTDPGSHPTRAPATGHSLGSISILVQLARGGDAAAREILARRCILALQGFANGRVPQSVRGRLDSDDLVQTAVMRAFERLDSFERRGHGSFLANLRTIVLNQIRDEARRLSSRTPHDDLGPTVADPGPSPLDTAIGTELVAAYESALARLGSDQRQAIVLRLEMGYSYQDIAEAIGSASPNAARMTVARALVRIAAEMEGHGQAAKS
jgi:RNA polymerase sigma-70 factor (ECF subfamily)